MNNAISNITPSPVTPNQPDKESNIKPLKNGLSIFSASRCGIYHEFNEDRILFDEHGSFYGLADGVGGGALGDKAAETLLQYLKSQSTEVPTADEIVSYLKQSDKIVRDELAKFNARGASTVVCAWLDKNGMGRYSCVGDARIYLITVNNENQVILEQITIDQTYGNLNAEPPTGGSYDDPARMVGVGAVGSPPVNEITLQHNQGLLFCSDGVHKFVSTEEMQEICTDYITPTGKNRSQINAVADMLVNRAKENRSHDDCSVMIVLNNQQTPNGLEENTLPEEISQKPITPPRVTKTPIQQISSQQNKVDITTNPEEPNTKNNLLFLKLFSVASLVIFVFSLAFLFNNKPKSNGSQPNLVDDNNSRPQQPKTVTTQPNNQTAVTATTTANHAAINTDKTGQEETKPTASVPKFEEDAMRYNLSNSSNATTLNNQPISQSSTPNFQQPQTVESLSATPNLNNPKTIKSEENPIPLTIVNPTLINANSSNANSQDSIMIIENRDQKYISIIKTSNENTTNKEFSQPKTTQQ